MRPIPFFSNLSALSMASIVPGNMQEKLIAMNHEKLIFDKLEFTIISSNRNLLVLTPASNKPLNFLHILMKQQGSRNK